MLNPSDNACRLFAIQNLCGRNTIQSAIDRKQKIAARIPIRLRAEDPLQHAKLVADLTDLQVVYRKAADWANVWPDDTAI